MQRTLIVIARLSFVSVAGAVEPVDGHRIGNTEYFSNGQNCITIGNEVYCS